MQATVENEIGHEAGEDGSIKVKEALEEADIEPISKSADGKKDI